jgi:acyl carrier protein
MTKEEFLKNFADQFDETDPGLIQLETKFRSIGEWSSMIALVIIAMVDEKYGAVLTGDEIRASETVEDIYKVVFSKVTK